MVDQEDARAAVVADGPDDSGEAGNLRLRQACCGLVHEHEPRMRRQGTRNAELPLVAVRQSGGGKILIYLQVEKFEELVATLLGLANGCATTECAHFDVLAHGQAAEGA